VKHGHERKIEMIWKKILRIGKGAVLPTETLLSLLETETIAAFFREVLLR
jgi:hypothetical protein